MLHYKQPAPIKQSKRYINIPLLPTGSTVAVQCKDRGSGDMMHRTIIGCGHKTTTGNVQRSEEWSRDTSSSETSDTW